MAENEVYEVEKILAQREIDGQLQFNVKWKNYDEEWNTWEPIDNLLDCFDLVLEFQEKNQTNVKKDDKTSKLARKEALKIVKKAKKQNSGSENLKKALQKHAAIVSNQDVSLNLSIDTSVLSNSSPSPSPARKSPKRSPSCSPKSKNLTIRMSPGALSPNKRTPKKPVKLEEFYDTSKMFIKSSSLSQLSSQTPKANSSQTLLRTLLTTAPVLTQTKLPVGNISSSSVASGNNSSESCSNIESNIKTENINTGKVILKQPEMKAPKNKLVKKSTGTKVIKSLKGKEKSLKTTKSGNILKVKLTPKVKKIKKEVEENCQNLESEHSSKKEKIKILKATKKSVVKKDEENSPKDISQKVKPKKKLLKKSLENSSEKKVKVNKKDLNSEKKIKVKKKRKLEEKDKGESKDKSLKRKYDTIEIIDTESDDDSITKVTVSPKSKKIKIDISPKQTDSVKKVEIPRKIEKELSKKTLQVKVKPMENSAGAKKIRLMDTMKPSTSLANPATKLIRPVSPTQVFTSVKPIMSRPVIPMESMCAEVPGAGYHYFPAMIPISPSSMSYKMILDSLPFQYHPATSSKKSTKKRDDDSMREDEVERRLSVRQSECAYKYKEIVVKKCNRYTQIWLNTHTKLKNSLNPQVIQEIVSALNSAKYDDSNLVMFGGLGNVFCSGIDLTYLISMDRKMAARKMVDALRDFMKALITFPKPLIAVVTGSAIGLGMTMLPLCDIVYASDKASFHLPYSQLCQTPEGCASFMLPNTVGMAMANELLLGGRKITAIEACQLGLVSQVFWPTSIMQEVIPRIENMALQSGKALETTKLLLRSHNRTKIELTNESECNLLLERWPSSECQKAIENYLNNENNFCI